MSTFSYITSNRYIIHIIYIDNIDKITFYIYIIGKFTGHFSTNINISIISSWKNVYPVIIFYIILCKINKTISTCFWIPTIINNLNVFRKCRNIFFG